MKRCKACRQHVEADSRFCKFCGFDLTPMAPIALSPLDDYLPPVESGRSTELRAQDRVKTADGLRVIDAAIIEALGPPPPTGVWRAASLEPSLEPSLDDGPTRPDLPAVEFVRALDAANESAVAPAKGAAALPPTPPPPLPPAPPPVPPSPADLALTADHLRTSTRLPQLDVFGAAESLVPRSSDPGAAEDARSSGTATRGGEAKPPLHAMELEEQVTAERLAMADNEAAEPVVAVAPEEPAVVQAELPVSPAPALATTLETLAAVPEEAPSPAPRQRRRSQRVVLQADVSFSSEHNFYTGFVRDISHGGLFVATYQVAPIGEAIDLELSIPGFDGSFKARCEVRWVREYNALYPDMVPGMGLAFREVPPEAVHWIDAFIQHRDPIFFDDE